MRILLCNFEYPPLGGGGGVISALLAQEMAKRHEVTVLTSHRRGLPRESTENGLRVVRVPVFFRRQEAVGNLLSMLSFIPMAIESGKRLLNTNGFDVVNTHFVLPSGPVGDVLSRTAGIPNILTVHGGDLYDPSKFVSPHRHFALRVWARRLIRRADLVIGQSTNTLGNMRRFYAPEIEGIRVPLAIPRPTFTPASRRDYGYNNDDFLLVTVGRLVPRKGISQLISVMETLRNQRVRLLIVGTGPQERFLKDECRARHLEDRIHFLGQVDEAEKFRILQISNLYVSTTQHEGFGLVFLEAMACGLPIVCYDHGGQTDFLRDGETGFVVSLNNADLFKNRCESLIANPEMRKTIAEKNRRLVEDYYIEKCALSYEGAFSEVVKLFADGARAFSPGYVQPKEWVKLGGPKKWTGPD